MADKRKANNEQSLVAVKRSKTAGAIIAAGPKRTSSLKAPIMLLTGHGAEVFSAKFNSDGSTIASASFDRQIYLWHTNGECDNYSVMTGHTGAILEIHWSTDDKTLFTASTDKTCAVWDAETGERIRRLRGHTSFVNSCCPAKNEPYVVTGSDDGTIKLWDSRRRNFLHSLANKYQVTAACYAATANQVITGGLDNVIKVWDTRKLDVAISMVGHKDTITGLRLSPDGNHVLSNSMDNTVRMWDVRPFAKDRLVKTFVGAQHNYEKNLIKCSWTPDGKHIGCGSADRNVYIWNVDKGNILYRLPGHTGTVNEVAFHPNEPIVVSASSDKSLYLGELNL
eukprot:m.13292 g.13292  ORF g.13292 m.13292 type:complete len:338 (-) comp4829_c0_seq2:2345-3358(-)